MIKLRLSRGGRKNLPFYQILATNNTSPRDSKFLEKMKQAILNMENDTSLENISNNIKFCSQDCKIKNNWNRHFYNYIESIFKNIEIIETLSNEEYDDLLTKNILN